MSEKAERLKRAFYTISDGKLTPQSQRSLLDNLSLHTESKTGQTYFALFAEALRKAGLTTDGVEIRIPRTHDGYSSHSNPSSPMGLTIQFNAMNLPRPLKDLDSHKFIGPLTQRDMSAQKNPTGAALLKALGVDPIHAEQVIVGTRIVEGKFVRDDNDPDGYRYDGGSYVTSLEIPFESAALSEVIKILDRRVAVKEMISCPVQDLLEIDNKIPESVVRTFHLNEFGGYILHRMGTEPSPAAVEHLLHTPLDKIITEITTDQRERELLQSKIPQETRDLPVIAFMKSAIQDIFGHPTPEHQPSGSHNTLSPA